MKESLHTLSDEELVHRYRNSHETVYVGVLYQRYTHLVYGVCLKYLKNSAEAEDATMQVFEKLIADLKRHHVERFKPWLHTVVKNYCMMHFRKEGTTEKNMQQYRHEQEKNVETEEVDHLQEAADREFVLQHLKEGLEELKEEQRTCVELFYLKDCSYAEIAAITGYSLKEVKSYIQNGKRNLKIYITSKNEQGKQE